MSLRRTPRLGLFGLLGSGNLGNDASLEAVLGFLRERHPDAVLDVMCSGTDVVSARYGLPTTRLNWNRHEYSTVSGPRTMALKAIGKLVDVFRTAAWVRRHDAVVVPGMGVLEATLPVRPWGFPYSLLVLSVCGRLFGTRIVLVGVGADVIRERPTRMVITRAARLAGYRSYRDELSRTAMREMGVDTSADEVYTDVAFALPAPAARARPAVVGLGVMAYDGDNGDRDRADEIRAEYVDKLKRFVTWLVQGGRQVRLLVGDELDNEVVAELLAGEHGDAVTAPPVRCPTELAAAMADVGCVVATRYHNVLCALRLGKPVVSIGYATKNDALMESMGLGRFCQSIRTLDVDRLIAQFTELEQRSGELRALLAERDGQVARTVEKQFEAMSAALSGKDGR
ncbi:polysaccharide pyruvyl transferase family protein [Prauserella oleivorans]|uniref:Polysaccharide pyruvyl transferase family protein n=1 Tax=Prauserella oleivorans TaxID=1478153 RepID=A0ABW5W493_9PSEU